MYFHQDERLAIFIDGQHLFSASRNLGFDVDYRNFLECFRKKGKVIRAYYYAVHVDNGEYSPLKPLTDWLAYNGYALSMRTTTEHTDSQGRRRIPHTDLEMLADMFGIADHVDHMVIVTGNGGYCRGVSLIQQRGVRVSVLSSIKTDSPMLSDDLRRTCDQFIELQEIKSEFTRVNREPRMSRDGVTPADPFGDGEDTPRAPARRRISA